MFADSVVYGSVNDEFCIHGDIKMQESNRSVAVVTGASRGAGRGIALALGESGRIVYVTGRSEKDSDNPLGGSIHETARLVTERGGQGIAVPCDHGDDDQVRELFAQIRDEQGRLDILVNNATYLPDELTQQGPFWDKPLDMWNINNVGLRSHYIAAWYAAPLMIAQRSGLIAFTSAPGARHYAHGPAYGVSKAGTDKMAVDMAHDLRPYNVASVPIWMGMLLTERTRRVLATEKERYGDAADNAETPEFTGRVIDALARDPKIMDRSGQIFIGAELALEYGVRDLDNSQPLSVRDMLCGPVQMAPIVIE